VINHAALIAGHPPLHVPRRHICWKLGDAWVPVIVLATLGVGMWVGVLGCLSILQ
jgi:ABC-type dipeptide/oligopeptide/nickel transport system permease subunit